MQRANIRGTLIEIVEPVQPVLLFSRWKYHEVCLLSLGLIQPKIMEMLQSNQLKFDANAVLCKLMVESCQLNAASGNVFTSQLSLCVLWPVVYYKHLYWVVLTSCFARLFALFPFM